MAVHMYVHACDIRMNIRMCVDMCMCIDMHAHKNTYACTYKCACGHVCKYVHTNLCVCVNMVCTHMVHKYVCFIPYWWLLQPSLLHLCTFPTDTLQ